MRKRLLCSFLTLFSVSAVQAQIQFTAKMEGGQETPPVSTTATARGSIEEDAAADVREEGKEGAAGRVGLVAPGSRRVRAGCCWNKKTFSSIIQGRAM